MRLLGSGSLAGATLALLLALGSGSVAGASSPAEAPAEMPAVSGAGLQVAIDPETGELRQPTAAEAQMLSERAEKPAALESFAAPVEVVWPDGTVTVELGEQFMNYWVVRRGAQGLEAACVDSEEAATALVNDSGSADGGTPALEEQ